MKCSECGNEINENANYCNNCGKKIVKTSNNQLLAFFAYIGFLVIIPILKKDESEFIKFHANQGLVLFILKLMIDFIIYIGNAFFGWFFLFEVFFKLISLPLNLVVVILCIIGIINVVNNEMKQLPLIGSIRLL